MEVSQASTYLSGSWLPGSRVSATQHPSQAALEVWAAWRGPGPSEEVRWLVKAQVYWGCRGRWCWGEEGGWAELREGPSLFPLLLELETRASLVHGTGAMGTWG